jgi:outer membrane biosynthesis protein TonB
MSTRALHRALCLAGSITAAALISLSAAPVAAQTANPKVIKKVPPEFPGEAIRKGVDKGVLKARVTIDGAGVPTEVSIVDTQPAKAKILNDTVIGAVNQWRFEGQGKPVTFDLQVVFTAD